MSINKAAETDLPTLSPASFISSSCFFHHLNKDVLTWTDGCAFCLCPNVFGINLRLQCTSFECEHLTESSLNQDKVCVVRMNQYFLAPPFMKPMLLMVSQPLRMICKTGKDGTVQSSDTCDEATELDDAEEVRRGWRGVGGRSVWSQNGLKKLRKFLRKHFSRRMHRCKETLRGKRGRERTRPESKTSGTVGSKRQEDVQPRQKSEGGFKKTGLLL